ncbi:MAG: glycosyltransferase family 4 protein [Methanocellales archaeon]|nr:glycosyltransferase family 4 protein [Methanocellales archaeon]
MRICIVAPYFTPFVRGNEFGLAESLFKLGNDVTIVTSTSRAPREKMVASGKGDEPNYNFKVKYLRTLVDVFENPIVPTAFIEILRGDYDVVLLQEDYPNICHMAFFASKIKRVPTVLSTERNYMPSDISKRVGLSFFDKTINRIVRNGVDVFTAHCLAAKDFMNDMMGVDRDIKVIHVGVDTKLFRPISDPEDFFQGEDDELRILSVARLHKHKGLVHLTQAMKGVIRDIPNAKLYIIGRGAEEQKLKSLVNALDLSRSISFIQTAIPNDMMPHVHSSCDLYVQPSIVEPFGIAVLEAMACAKPVIASNVGGMKDTVVDGHTGFLVPPGDVKDLKDKIVELLTNREKRSVMGRNGRKRAVAHFDWMKIGAEYQKLLKSIS